MGASYSGHLTTPFVVGPAQLEAISRLLERNVGPIQIRINCVDDIEREVPDIGALLQYENPKSKEILDLRIDSKSTDLSSTASIKFSASRWRGIEIDVCADEDSVSRVKTGLLDIIDGARPWYSPIQGVDFAFAGAVAIFFLIFTALLIPLFTKTQPARSKRSSKQTDKQNAIAMLVVFGTVVAVSTLGYILNLVRDSWFPYAVFAIGQGDTRFQNLERWHWGFLIAVVASLIASFLVWLWKAWQSVPDSQDTPSTNS